VYEVNTAANDGGETHDAVAARWAGIGRSWASSMERERPETAGRGDRHVETKYSLSVNLLGFYNYLRSAISY